MLKSSRMFVATLFVALSLLLPQGQVLASDLPNFTSCVNPQGEIKASYDSGIHGIAGKAGTFEGKDTVYSLSENALTQCFCASDGTGIQTNWLKASDLTENEIKVLTSQGWIYIPNGALWGLEETSYLALNSDFSCKNSSGAGGGGTGDNSGSSSSSNGSGSGGSASGASSTSGGVGQVLGLASTGNSAFLLTVSTVSIITLLLGIILKKRAKNFSK